MHTSIVEGLWGLVTELWDLLPLEGLELKSVLGGDIHVLQRGGRIFCDVSNYLQIRRTGTAPLMSTDL